MKWFYEVYHWNWIEWYRTYWYPTPGKLAGSWLDYQNYKVTHKHYFFGLIKTTSKFLVEGKFKNPVTNDGEIGYAQRDEVIEV